MEVERKKKLKTKKIIFRVTREMWEFLNDFARSLGTTPSELLRTVVTEYFLAYYTENYKFNYKEMKERFLKMYSEQNSFGSEKYYNENREEHSGDEGIKERDGSGIKEVIQRPDKH